MVKLSVFLDILERPEVRQCFQDSLKHRHVTGTMVGGEKLLALEI